jgi:ethanolamine transporter
MNFFIIVMLFCAVLGLLDLGLGGKWGLAEPFSKGLSMMGQMALSMCGLYAVGVSLVASHAEAISRLTAGLPFDPSLLVACLLPPDMGGYPIALRLAADPAMGLFSGLLVCSTLGTVTGCQLPIFLGVLGKEDAAPMLASLFLGVGVLPPALFIGGILLGIPAPAVLLNLLPVCVFCALMILLLVKARTFTTVLLRRFGNFIKFLGYFLFALLMADLYLPQMDLVTDQLRNEVFTLLVQVAVMISGALVFSHLLVQYCQRPLRWLSSLLRVNDYAVIGLVLGLTSSLAMLPLFPKMDTRGKWLNGAFSAALPYVIGGQMAFVSALVDESALGVYFLTKLLGGAAAVAAAMLFTRREKLQKEPPNPCKDR